MISPHEIKIKAERKYVYFLQSIVQEVPFSRIIIPADKRYNKTSVGDFQKEILALVNQSKEKKGFGYTLDFHTIKTKTIGTQSLPTNIYFDTEKDFLKFLGKEMEVNLFKLNCETILTSFPELNNWIVQNPQKIIQNQTEWEGILKVCNYFRQNPKPNLYLRELPINVHTKFIERNQSIIKDLLDFLISENVNNEEKHFEKRFNLKYSEPQIRFKVLDKGISQTYFSGLDDIAIPNSQFETLKLPVSKVLVVENKTTLYTTLTLPEMKSTIAIFGSGFSVINLKNVKWFSNLKLLYWGDIDVHGFQILSQFRGYFPHTESVFMNKQTFDKYFENDLGTISNVTTSLNLTEDELQLYEILKTKNWRLEQEKIPFEYVKQNLL